MDTHLQPGVGETGEQDRGHVAPDLYLSEGEEEETRLPHSRHDTTRSDGRERTNVDWTRLEGNGEEGGG